jgi:hypothetical protein
MRYLAGRSIRLNCRAEKVAELGCRTLAFFMGAGFCLIPEAVA